MIYMLTVQGADSDGNVMIESWMIPAEMYFQVRGDMPAQPDEITVVDPDGNVIYRGSNP